MALNHKLLAQATVGSRVSQRVDLRPLIMACVLLATLLGQFIGPLVANTLCGLIIPHEHILIGQADDHDLERHLAAEENCATGKPDAPDKQAAELQGHKGHIFNVISSDRSDTSHLMMLFNSIADLPTGIVVERSQPFYYWLEPIHLFGPSVTISPPKPPPKTG